MHPYHRKGAEIPVHSSRVYGNWKLIAGRIASGAVYSSTIQGNLNLAHLRIRSLPDEFRVAGHLDLRQCTRLVRLGSNTRVEGDLLIGGALPTVGEHQVRFANEGNAPFGLGRGGQCPLKALPPGLRVAGDLILRSCRSLEELPDDIVIGGNLILIGCAKLKRLPALPGLSGDLVVIGSPLLRELPAGLRLRNLYLFGCGIQRLPGEILIQESIRLEKCAKLEAMPVLEHTPQIYEIIACPNASVPAGIRALDTIRLKNLPFRECPISFRAPRVKVTNCASLEIITGEFVQVSALILRDCPKLRAFPAPQNRANRMNELDVSNCRSLTAIPSGVRILGLPRRYALNVKNCRSLKALPEYLVLSGWVNRNGSGITAWPAHLKDVEFYKWWRGPRWGDPSPQGRRRWPRNRLRDKGG